MIKVKVPAENPNEVMELVRELRSQGLVQGLDFDFFYNPTTWDNITGHMITEKYTLFTFYVDKHATLFILKYAK